ncbi:hypothetical protein EXIGLDRAFT_294054 [Exidia glandulosa HHB12029]|uniref:Uncharacterized protein n=1 Tax=Exidia glandulosa HHB12029 TaxID=1314781 RepID=A0A165DDQ6_EXIGL|nr:hypothetical protein EXIGLDRAFT_294054 [Exidia glandulosa HHB12029]
MCQSVEGKNCCGSQRLRERESENGGGKLCPYCDDTLRRMQRRGQRRTEGVRGTQSRGVLDSTHTSRPESQRRPRSTTSTARRRGFDPMLPVERCYRALRRARFVVSRGWTSLNLTWGPPDRPGRAAAHQANHRGNQEGSSDVRARECGVQSGCERPANGRGVMVYRVLG